MYRGDQERVIKKRVKYIPQMEIIKIIIIKRKIKKKSKEREKRFFAK